MKEGKRHTANDGAVGLGERILVVVCPRGICHILLTAAHVGGWTAHREGNVVRCGRHKIALRILHLSHDEGCVGAIGGPLEGGAVRLDHLGNNAEHDLVLGSGGRSAVAHARNYIPVDVQAFGGHRTRGPVHHPVNLARNNRAVLRQIRAGVDVPWIGSLIRKSGSGDRISSNTIDQQADGRTVAECVFLDRCARSVLVCSIPVMRKVNHWLDRVRYPVGLINVVEQPGKPIHVHGGIAQRTDIIRHRGLILKLRVETDFARRIGEVPLGHTKRIGRSAIAPIVQVGGCKGEFIIPGQAAACSHIVPVLGSKCRVIGELLLVPDFATCSVAFVHVAIRRQVRTIGLNPRIDRIPGGFDGRQRSRKARIVSAVVFLPVENRRMTAIADNHVAMQLLLQRGIVRGWVVEITLSIPARLVDHDAVCVGGLHKLFTARRVAGSPDIASLRRDLSQITPVLFIWNRGAKGGIIVTSSAAPQILGMSVEVREVRIPGNGADAKRTLRRIHHHAVDADDVVDLVHIRRSVDRVIRIPQGWIRYSDQLLKHRC